MAQEFALAAPKTEEMTKIGITGVGAGITGAVQGVVVKMAPQLGALEPIFTWGTLLGIPVMGAAGALFTRGMIGDFFLGVACGGLGVVGYTLPAMMEPIIGRRPGGGQLSAEQRAALAAGGGVKQLAAGVLNAPARAQAAAKVGLEF